MADETLPLFPALVRDKYRPPRKPVVWALCPICRCGYPQRFGRQACSLPCRTQVSFWRHVDKQESCWIWTGARDKGYGIFRGPSPSKRMTYRAYVYSYTLHIGEVPEGYELDHLCRNRACVNPAHLEPVTHKENVYRGEGLCAQNAAKTHCKYGHPFDVDNTIVFGKGYRRCRTCQRRTAREWARRAREKYGDHARTIESGRSCSDLSTQ